MLFKPEPLIGPVQIETNLAMPARHHNYSVGGNMVNGFAAGAVGADDDLWLVALPPPDEGEGANRPLIHCNLIDGFGRRLVTLAANEPTFNPKGCTVSQDDTDLRVRGPDGQEVLRIHTAWVRSIGYHVSYFHCRLKDKAGVIRLEGRGASDAPTLVIHGKMAYGYRPGLPLANNMGLSDEQMARAVALTGSAEAPAEAAEPTPRN